MPTSALIKNLGVRCRPSQHRGRKSVSKDRETVADAGLARLIVRSTFYDVVIGDI
jgi:hypothetical protein